MDMQSLTFGERLRLARTQKKLTQSDLAMSKGFISDVENGKRDMSGKHIVLVCAILGITPNWLLLGTEEANDHHHRIGA
jgi:transcriptional regulator with XRE-family HTH domain